MQLAEWIMAIFTGLIGLGALGAAVFNTDKVFELRKLAFLESRLGRNQTRALVAIGGLLLIALAVSFVAIPPE